MAIPLFTSWPLRLVVCLGLFPDSLLTSLPESNARNRKAFAKSDDHLSFFLVANGDHF